MMKEKFKQYNKKYFRNIQFIYDFFEKNGMTNSLITLKNETQVDHIKYYDNFFLNDFEHFDCDESAKGESETEDELFDNSSDDFDIDPDFLKKTINNMNNSLLCKAIDAYEEMLKSDSNILQKTNYEKNETQLEEEKRVDLFEQDTQTENEIKNLLYGKIEGEKKLQSQLSPQLQQLEMKDENEIEFEIENNDSKEKEKIQIIPELKYSSLKTETKENISEAKGIINEDHIVEYNSNWEEKRNRKICRCKTEIDKNKISKEEKKTREKENENEWESYFSCEKEIGKKLNIKHIQFQVCKDKNNTCFGDSNILTVKYIDIYEHFFTNPHNTKFENVLFYCKYIPLLILIGNAKNCLNVILAVYENSSYDNYKNSSYDNYEKNINNKEQKNIGNVLIFETLESVTMNSPVMYIDINYENNYCIVSTMSGEIYFYEIYLDYLKELIENIELIDNFETLSEKIKKKKKEKKRNIFNLLKIYNDHTKYSLKCAFNEDYTLFATIANDKNLNFYERMYNKEKENYFYEKIKTVGLPEVPTSFLWVISNRDIEQNEINGKEKDSKGKEKEKNVNKKEEIVIGMLNSNHILFLNSVDYHIDRKIDLFHSNEKYNILNLAYNKKKNILVICTDTSQLFVYSLTNESIIKIIYGCVLNALSFPSLELNNNGDFIYVTSDDKINGTFILTFDIKSGNIINKINNGFKIRCFQIFRYCICSDQTRTTINEVNRNKKGLLFLGSFDKKLHFYVS